MNTHNTITPDKSFFSSKNVDLVHKVSLLDKQIRHKKIIIHSTPSPPPPPPSGKQVLMFFIYLHKVICCVYSLEVPSKGATNEYHISVEKYGKYLSRYCIRPNNCTVRLGLSKLLGKHGKICTYLLRVHFKKKISKGIIWWRLSHFSFLIFFIPLSCWINWDATLTSNFQPIWLFDSGCWLNSHTWCQTV